MTVCPNIVGRPKGRMLIQGEQKDTYIGNEADQKRGILKLNYPIEGGQVSNWDDMELIWDDLFTN